MEILFFFGLPKKQIKKLQGMQHSAARIVCCKGRCDHVTPILQGLHWLPVEKHIIISVTVDLKVSQWFGTRVFE